MADNKGDKPGKGDSPFTDNKELFESLFREELAMLAGNRKEKITPKPDRKAIAAKRPKPPSQVKAPPLGKVLHKPETGQAAKKRPVSHEKIETSRNVAPRIDAIPQRRAAKRSGSQVKGGITEEVSHRKVTNMKKIKSGRIGSGPKLGRGSDNLKIALLCVVLAVAVGLIINSLGIVDFRRLLGFSEPTEKQSTKTRVAKERTAKKPAPVAVQSPQETATPSGTERTTSIIKRRIVQKPPETATAFADPGVAQRPTKPAVPTQTRLTTRQTRSAPPSTQKPVVGQTPPVSAPPAQKPAVVQKPAEPAPSIREPVIARTSPSPATPIQKKAFPDKKEIVPEERTLPYPYSVYLGSYQTLDRAEKAISEYRTKGLSAYWVKVDLGEKGVWHRVFTGYFKDHAEATAFINKKRLSEGEVKRTRYATLIGVYGTEADLKREFLTLSKLGYSPYVIEMDNGESQLYVGAFYTKAGAEEQRTDLASKGIQSRVVVR